MDVKLVMFKANGQRKDFPIINPVTIIGRGENCDLQVPLLSVSRRQCQLTITEDGSIVKDLASSNGTYVNNRRINEVEISAGDRLVIGPIVFTLQIDGQPEEIQPVKTRGQVMAEQNQPGTAQVVDLDADVIATPGASVLEDAGTVISDSPFEISPGEDADSISAMEALSEQEDEQEQSE